MKFLAKIKAGSHLYGLNTPESDIDWRGVFLNEEPSKILGLDKHEQQTVKSDDDEAYYELRYFLAKLRSCNTQLMEILCAREYHILNPDFKRLVIEQKARFFDTKKLFKCLSGYLHSEKRKVMGERQGEIGGKRMEAVKKYGYSPKNAVQALRLAYVGRVFFDDGVYLTDLTHRTPHHMLLEIKTNPGNYKAERILELINEWERLMYLSFDRRPIALDFKFDEDYANQVLLEFYGPIIQEHMMGLGLNF